MLTRKANLGKLAAMTARLARVGLPVDQLAGVSRSIQAIQVAKGKTDHADDFVAALRESPVDPYVRSGIGSFLRNGNFHSEEQVAALEDTLARLALPTHIRIETASVCNLRCQHCTTGVAYDSTDRRVMAMSTFDRVLEQVRTLPTVRLAIMYLGGEPLVNRHHATMCRRVKDETQIGKVKFVTNAMLLNAQWCDEIAEANVDLISISIDGRSPEENDSIRVGATYETIRDNIRMLKQRLDDKGAATRIVIANTVFKRLEDPSQPTSPKFLLDAFPDIPVTSGYAMVWPGMKAEDTALEGLSVYQKKPRRFCDHPFYDIAVRANGDVILCCYDISGQHVMGNVLRDDLLDLYQSDAYVELRRAMLRRDESAVPDVCRRCVNFTGDRFIQDSMRL